MFYFLQKPLSKRNNYSEQSSHLSTNGRLYRRPSLTCDCDLTRPLGSSVEDRLLRLVHQVQVGVRPDGEGGPILNGRSGAPGIGVRGARDNRGAEEEEGRRERERKHGTLRSRCGNLTDPHFTNMARFRFLQFAHTNTKRLGSGCQSDWYSKYCNNTTKDFESSLFTWLYAYICL